jgi:hypothetical protein
MRKEEHTDRGYSPDVAEILDRKPRWLIRRGILLAAVIFAACLVATYFIPYPERLNCEVSFLIPQPGKGDEQTVHGVARLPEKYASLVKTGLQVRIIVPRESGGNPIKTRGVVADITRDPGSNYYTMMVHVETLRGMAEEILGVGHGSAQIVTGQSNLLRQVFNPIISVIRGANKKK